MTEKQTLVVPGLLVITISLFSMVAKAIPVFNLKLGH